MPSSSSAPDAVRLTGVTKRFGETEVVSGLDLSIAAGEFFSLLGPSGCGKTTTLRMIAGFDQPTSGDIDLDGERMTEVPAHRRPVNTVFQDYALFEHLNVADNIAFGLKRRKVGRTERLQRVADALDLVQLSDRANARTTELSGGQQQRVALARALVCRPQVLLLDEPLGALDLALRRQMQVELKRIQREVGITFLYVTHDQEEALAMSDRIGVMDGGHLLQVGVPEDVYERPTRPFVADFIGVSNLMAGTVSDDGVRLASGRTYPLTVPGGLTPGTDVLVAVRPEKIWIDEQEPGMITVPGTVTERIYLGTTTQLIVRTVDEATIVALEQNTDRSRSDARWEVGQQVVLAWRPEDALVLPDPSAS